MIETVGTYVDRQITIEPHPNGRIAHGVVRELYAAAREEYGEPLTLRAARLLDDAVSKDDAVLITTGAGMAPKLPNGEMDGLLGTVGLARALSLGSEAQTIVVAEDHIEPPIIGAARAAGLCAASPEVIQDRGSGVAFESIPVEDEPVAARLEELFEKYQPAAVVSVEKLGPNELGEIHSGGGENWSDTHANVAPLFDVAHENDVPTVAIGDLGNEIGFGRLADTVREKLPFGDECQCPCERGNACVTEADALVVASVSNWGASGIQAAMAAVQERPELLHGPDEWKHMYDAAVQHGALDGPTGYGFGYDDGIPEDAHRGVHLMLNSIVRQWLRTPENRYYWA